MKSRLIWAAVMIAAVCGFYFMTIQPTLKPTPPRIPRRVMKELRPPEIPAPALPMPVVTTPEIPLPPLPQATLPAPRPQPRPVNHMEVPIQHGTTMDFSTGTPSVRSVGEDKAAIDRAMKDILEATKDIKFEPTAPKKE